MRNRLRALTSLPCLIGLVLASATVRAEADAWVKPAEQLQRATVTVRVSSEPERPAKDNVEPKEQAVIICTGVSVGQGNIITCVAAGSDSRIRLTLPGGAQAEARVRVIDEYSGLTLLQTEKTDLASLELASDPPASGSGVMIASAWGAEKPVFSVGIVAGVDRLLSGTTCPPLIQSDVRITDTSSGAGLINVEGKLLGIVVAAAQEASRRDWTYAVPVSHLQRLLRMAKGDGAVKGNEKPGVIILKRQRPVVGLRLEEVDDRIVIHRLTPQGPAERAGLKVGDQVLGTDGVNIRSVYQAVLPTLHKQPGDTLRFRVQREGAVQEIDVVLGGGVEVPNVPLRDLGQYIQPQLQVGRDGKGSVVTRRSLSPEGEVFATPRDAGSPASSAVDQTAILEKALDRYRGVIEYQQRELVEERSKRAEMERQLDDLQSDLETLRRKISDAPGSSAASDIHSPSPTRLNPPPTGK